MNQTKIDWCDSTWNPVTGCYHNCPYCYARKIANRFGLKPSDDLDDSRKIHVLSKKMTNPYPFGFQPTFHQYRLNEYNGKAKPRNIFVGSMTDLFGAWVPEGWKRMVLRSCADSTWHNYLFLTKSPENIPCDSHLYSGMFTDHWDCFWFGTTVTCQKDLEERLWPLLNVRGHLFLSIEPLLEEIDLDSIFTDDGALMISVPRGQAFSLNRADECRMPEWVIIGAETGNRKDRVIPEREWIEKIVSQCRLAGIPIFMKESPKSIWGKDLIREYPEELRHH